MVKILGFNGKIIIAILYVYYCEINADTQILDSWQSNSRNGAVRRAQAKKKTSSEPKNQYRQERTSRGADTDKFTRDIRPEIQISAPIHYPRHDPPHIEPVLRNFEDPSSNSDSDSDNNRHKYYDMDWSQNTDRYHDPDKDHKIPKDHKMDKNYNTNRNPTTTKNKNHSMYRSHNRNRISTTPKHHNVDKSLMRDRGSSANKEYNVDRNSNMKKHQHIDKNHMKDKSHNKVMNHYMDRTQDKDNNKMEKNHENDHTSKKYPKKERHRDKSRGKDSKLGEPMRIPKLHPEPVQGRISALERTTKKSTTHHHRSKLRTHKHRDEITFIQSTRLTPMYLMNQQSETEVYQKLDETAKQQVPEALSPYSLQSQMTRILNQFSEANATVETIGRTVEYNDIVIIKITEKKSDMGKYFRAEESKYIDEVPEKKIILIVHGLSVMGMNKIPCMSNESSFKILLSYYLAHLEKFDIFLIPMANPDGYSAIHSVVKGASESMTDYMLRFRVIHKRQTTVWNKNVSPQDACAGVALDRNFDVAWNGSKHISSCSQLYPGPSPFSEIESKVVRDVFHYHGHKILAYIHVHAGTYTHKVFKGDAILYPKGYTDSQTDDDKYIDLKGEIDEAMKNASFQVMSVAVETLYTWYGRVTGTSVDYASSVYGIPYAMEFVMQLYDTQYDPYDQYALTDIWGRLIETTFNNMWKTLHTNEIRRK